MVIISATSSFDTVESRDECVPQDGVGGAGGSVPLVPLLQTKSSKHNKPTHDEAYNPQEHSTSSPNLADGGGITPREAEMQRLSSLTPMKGAGRGNGGNGGGAAVDVVDLHVDEQNPGSWFVRLQMYITCCPWIFRETDVRRERGKKAAIFANLVVAGLSGLLLLAGLVAELASTGSRDAALIVSATAAALIFTVAFATWIVVNMLTSPACCGDEIVPSPVTADSANNPAKSNNNNNPYTDNNAKNNNNNNKVDSNNKSFLLSESASLSISITDPVLGAMRNEVNPIAVDFSVFVNLCCCCTIGVCWAGAGTTCLLIAVTSFAVSAAVETTETFRPFVVRPSMFVVGIYLSLRAAEESFLLSQDLAAVPSFAYRIGGASAAAVAAGSTAGSLAAVCSVINITALLMFMFMIKTLGDRDRVGASQSELIKTLARAKEASQATARVSSHTVRLGCRVVSALLHNDVTSAKMLMGRFLPSPSSAMSPRPFATDASAKPPSSVANSDENFSSTNSTVSQSSMHLRSPHSLIDASNLTALPSAAPGTPPTFENSGMFEHRASCARMMIKAEEQERSDVQAERERLEKLERQQRELVEQLDPKKLFPLANMRAPIIKALVSMIERWEQYINFVPDWVKNPALDDEEEEEGTGTTSATNDLDMLNRSDSVQGHNMSTHSASEGKPGSERSVFARANINSNKAHGTHHGEKKGGGGMMYGEFDLNDDDDITSVRAGEGGSQGVHANIQSLAVHSAAGGAGGAEAAGHSGKVTLAVLTIDLDFVRHSAEMRVRGLNEGSSGTASAPGSRDGNTSPLSPADGDSLPNIARAQSTEDIANLVRKTSNSNSNIYNVLSPKQPLAHAKPTTGLDSVHVPSGGSTTATAAIHNNSLSAHDVERKITERVLEQIAVTGGTLHSIVAGRITVSWNAMARISAPEHKASRCLITCHQLSAEFPGLRLTGAAMTGFGRAVLAHHNQLVAPCITVRWWRELDTLATLARLDNTVLVDMATKHAVFFEFVLRGHGCIQRASDTQIGEELAATKKGTSPLVKQLLTTNREATAKASGLFNAAGLSPSDASGLHFKHHASSAPNVITASIKAERSGLSGNSNTSIGNNSNNNNNNNNASPVTSSSSSKDYAITTNRSAPFTDDSSPGFAGGAATPTIATATAMPGSQSLLLPIFSLISRRTGGGVEWMYLLQGGGGEGGDGFGDMDPAGMSCTAIDHAAAGNFVSAKKELEHAIVLAEAELQQMAEKKSNSTSAAAATAGAVAVSRHNFNASGPSPPQHKSAAERDMELLDQQIANNKYSVFVFKRLVQRLEDKATVSAFPFKVVAQ